MGRLKKRFSIHPVWIIYLLLPILVTIVFIYRNSADLLFIILSACATAYMLIAVVHHYRNKSLKLELVIEYVLIAALALIILYSLAN